MLQPYKTRSSVGVATAMVLFVAGGIGSGTLLESNPQASRVFWGVAFPCGAALWLWGCYNHAKSRGYSGWWGLLGFLTIPGLIILLVLPDLTKEQSKASSAA